MVLYRKVAFAAAAAFQFHIIIAHFTEVSAVCGSGSKGWMHCFSAPISNGEILPSMKKKLRMVCYISKKVVRVYHRGLILIRENYCLVFLLFRLKAHRFYNQVITEGAHCT